MICAWKELLSILPPWLREETDRIGRAGLQELRMRAGDPPELIVNGVSQWLCRSAAEDDLNFCVNTASKYSPWAAASVAKGYLTAPGGHRIGLCGQAVWNGSSVTGIREIRSICIRVARDFPGIGRNGALISGSILIIGPPGWGKTTLLRDICRAIAQKETVSVVDERGELFPDGFPRGRRMDILWGCPKPSGIDMVLRTMGPQCIAVDEITAAEDCDALRMAANCGVRLLATAHAASVKELRSRPVYRPLIDCGIFETILIMQPDKSYKAERMGL